MHGGYEKCLTKFSRKLEGRDLFRYQCIDERLILKLILKVAVCEGASWIHMAQNIDL
jgi:hypothetical protein